MWVVQLHFGGEEVRYLQSMGDDVFVVTKKEEEATQYFLKDSAIADTTKALGKISLGCLRSVSWILI